METIQNILEEMKTVLSHVEPEQYKGLVELLRQDGRLFFTGEGRSGFVMKAIAMRLMHAGKPVYVVGETITPSTGSGDALIVLSGSGTTASSVHVAKQAQKSGAQVFLVTAEEDALQSEPFRHGLVIPAATKSNKHTERRTIQPLGNQFDQAAHLVLDAAVIDAIGGTSFDSLKARHANLE